MKKDISRLILSCAVILGFALIGYNISFAHTQSPNLQASHFIPATEMSVIGAVTPKEQTPSTWESALKGVFWPALALGLPLLIVRVLASSAASMLPVLPQAGAATAQEQAAPSGSGGRVKFPRPLPTRRPAWMNAFPYHALTMPHVRHLLRNQRFRRIFFGDYRHWRFRCLAYARTGQARDNHSLCTQA
ncbi:MAG: hypothetical protein ACM37Z_12030 [Deltaproteobacteria bacterium]|jgi:hypothetical protein